MNAPQRRRVGKALPVGRPLGSGPTGGPATLPRPVLGHESSTGAGIGRLLLSVGIVVSVGICAGATAPMQSRAGGARPPIVLGYPYSSRCPAAGRDEVVDRWGMYACNCTSYVAWALHANGQRTHWFVRGSMDAWNWPNVARRAGFRVTWRPRVGAVAVWPKLGRPFGHLAYVTRVHSDESFDVAEYNLPGARAHRFQFDLRRSVAPGGAVFIYVPERS